MFRVTQFMQELIAPTPARARSDLPGPVVIWNLIRRCNLACRHCYSISADTSFPGELSTDEAFAVLDDLYASRVRVLILSGGEPLLRPDLYRIACRAKSMGFHVCLSTNGTLIGRDNIDALAALGLDYLGVSLDGMRETHDRFRRKAGAFDASLAGIRLARDADIKVGLRFTLTQDNAAELAPLLQLADDERIDRFYLSHLNYAGRGNVNRARDAHHLTTRQALGTLFDWCWEHLRAGTRKEVVTGNNDADGPYLLQWVRGRMPHRAKHLRRKLTQWGGNASGVNVANIDNLGNVHPDTMWWHYNLGNVRSRSFGEIWHDTSDPLMAGLKMRPRPVKGRCAACRHLDICGGNTRVRAQQVTGDPWAEDPGCYLDDHEIGVEPGTARVRVTPYSRRTSIRPAADESAAYAKTA